MNVPKMPMGLLSEITLPSEIAASYAEVCRLRGMSESERLIALEELTLRYTYGGLLVVCEETEQGRKIIVTDADGQVFQDALEIMHQDATGRYSAFNVPTLDD